MRLPTRNSLSGDQIIWTDTVNWSARDRAPWGKLAAIKKGTGDAVLLLHGVGLRAEAWAAQIDVLSREYSVTAPDIPGHGESERFDELTHLADFTDRVAQAISEPTLVVGHSMGAMIAMDLAIRYPAKIRAVAALNAIFQRDAGASTAVQIRSAALARIEEFDPEPTLQRWFGDSNAAEMQACRSWLTSVKLDSYRAAYSVFANENGPSESDLANVRCTVSFMTGAAEPNSTPEMSQKMANLTPNGRALIVEAAAHMMPMTHRVQVNTALLSFFRDVSR
jgi:pimeloyl-ACP methyl ester carboxylesterase